MKVLHFFWGPSPPKLTLSSDHVHVWCVALDQAAARLQQYVSLLSADERMRAERFHFALPRNRFVIGRGLLRTILSYYSGIEPSQLQLSYGPYGKPSLADASNTTGLKFNLSHSEALALLAVTRDREIGVDLEFLRPVADAEQIAERYFSPRESGVFRALPPGQKQQAFFNCWTRKEAYIKARGQGLSFPLEQFDVSLVPGEPAKLTGTRPDPREALRWSLHKLVPAPNYVGAVAVAMQSDRPAGPTNPT